MTCFSDIFIYYNYTTVAYWNVFLFSRKGQTRKVTNLRKFVKKKCVCYLGITEDVVRKKRSAGAVNNVTMTMGVAQTSCRAWDPDLNDWVELGNIVSDCDKN